MKVVIVIPARFQSSRFEGKPLADIFGKPMIWWTYQQASKIESVSKVLVATDSKKIEETCIKHNMNVIMTKDSHSMMLERVHEVSNYEDADLYISVAGDEPLIEPEIIETIISSYKNNHNDVINLRTPIKNPVDVVNFTTMKVVTDSNGYALYASRSPIPYPKASLDIKYYKHMGMYGLTKKALDFFVNSKRDYIENIEDFDLLRFLEHGMKVKIEDVVSNTISVDTPKDLERVKKIIKNRENI